MHWDKARTQTGPCGERPTGHCGQHTEQYTAVHKEQYIVHKGSTMKLILPYMELFQTQVDLSYLTWALYYWIALQEMGTLYIYVYLIILWSP